MNQLVVTNGKHLAPHRAQANPLDGLPRWLAYLASSYPSSKLSDEAFLVMEDQFVEFDPAALYEAAREFVRSDKRTFKSNPGGFPTAPEFREVAERLQAQREEREYQERLDRLIAAWQERAKLHNRLRGQRTVILRAWYRGRVGNRVLLAMANKLDAAGLECAAASLRSKLS